MTGFFSDYSRAYFSYNEALRYPNMFESVIAFGASVSPFRDLKPEHTYSYELGYIQELGHLLGDGWDSVGEHWQHSGLGTVHQWHLDCDWHQGGWAAYGLGDCHCIADRCGRQYRHRYTPGIQDLAT